MGVRSWRVTVLAFAVVCLTATEAAAAANAPQYAGAARRLLVGPQELSGAGVQLAPRSIMGSQRPTDDQRGSQRRSLPPASVNVDLVSKLRLHMPDANGEPDPTKPVLPEQIADVSVYKNAAYLNSWRTAPVTAAASSPSTSPTRRTRGRSAFVPALPGRYHGEGAHVISVDTPQFKGDVLAVNNEPCSATGARRLRSLRRDRSRESEDPGPGGGRSIRRRRRRAGHGPDDADASPAQQLPFDLHLAGRRRRRSR